MARHISIPRILLAFGVFLAPLLATASAVDALPITKSYGSIPPVLPRVTKLNVQRGFVPKNIAQELYEEILDCAIPGPRDSFHSRLLGITGDAGGRVNDAMTTAELVDRFQRIVRSGDEESNKEEREKPTKESGILRVEHLKDIDYPRANQLINKAVQNNVLTEDGTIHMYLSKPESSALANHTDTTDIVVLQLKGAKEWLLCRDEETTFRVTAAEASLRGKLSKCTTYNDLEMSNFSCERLTLFPGDALFLPKRVVHSARATQDGLSAHITFAFADNTCGPEENPTGVKHAKSGADTLRFLKSTCNAAEGGTDCTENCNSACDGSCDLGCNGSCGCGPQVAGCCDSSCDSSCDSYCDDGCNTSCNTCPETPNVPNMQPTMVGPSVSPSAAYSFGTGVPSPLTPGNSGPSISTEPSAVPSDQHTNEPSSGPSYWPSLSTAPSASAAPSKAPSSLPSSKPTLSTEPSAAPSDQSSTPTNKPIAGIVIMMVPIVIGLAIF